jgi:pimeloyl-ACP methyl ester carboxylesterase
MELVFQDDTLRVERLPGEGRRLVVALSGIGQGFGGLQRVEFAKTASDNGRNRVLFVSDRMRSWYTSKGLVARITDLVNEELERVGLSACHTLGNSMGGYGAVRLSVDFPVVVALSFSPQVTMDLTFINETRWEEHRPAIVMDHHLPLWDCLRPETRYYMIFGAASRRELAHRELLPDRPELRVLMLSGGGHNIVQLLKAAGCMTDLINAMLDQDENEITQVILRYEAALKAGALGSVPP